jgi:hypothetical protein
VATASAAAARNGWTLGWLSAAAVPVAALCVILADTEWTGSAQLSAAIRTRLVGQLLLAEAALLAIWAPLVGVFTALRVRHAGDELAGMSTVRGRRRSAWQLGRPLVTRIMCMTATSAAIAWAMGAAMPTDALLRSHAILGAAALAFAALGAACGATFREPLDAGASAIGIALLAAFALFGGGPALDSIPRWLLHAALVVNPIVATAASANIDLFRMDLLYQLSPLAHRHVEYPAFGLALTVYVLIAVTWLLLGSDRLKTKVTTWERMSS